MSVFGRIVVGVDGREGGRDALALAALLQGICGLLLGSTSTRLVRDSACPLLILPRGADAPDTDESIAAAAAP
jgi:nucleotide-binding universal stress UspA family protein